MEFKIKLQIWTQNEIWKQTLKLEMEPKTEQSNLNLKLKKQIGPKIKSKQFLIIHGLISSPITKTWSKIEQINNDFFSHHFVWRSHLKTNALPWIPEEQRTELWFKTQIHEIWSVDYSKLFHIDRIKHNTYSAATWFQEDQV